QWRCVRRRLRPPPTRHKTGPRCPHRGRVGIIASSEHRRCSTEHACTLGIDGHGTASQAWVLIAVEPDTRCRGTRRQREETTVQIRTTPNDRQRLLPSRASVHLVIIALLFLLVAG